MSAKHLSLIATALALVLPAGAALAQSQTAAPLAGTVSSAKEGLMEGVVVSAKKVGSTVTISVATDDKGRFSFPAARLEPGQYALSIRAVGYDLEGPQKRRRRRRQDRERRHQARADQEPAPSRCRTPNGSRASRAPTTRRRRCSTA